MAKELSADDVLEFRLDVINNLKLHYEDHEHGYINDSIHLDIFLLSGDGNQLIEIREKISKTKNEEIILLKKYTSIRTVSMSIWNTKWLLILVWNEYIRFRIRNKKLQKKV